MMRNLITSVGVAILASVIMWPAIAAELLYSSYCNLNGQRHPAGTQICVNVASRLKCVAYAHETKTAAHWEVMETGNNLCGPSN
jgi:hypothetical protein